jgi:hypothetical protein
MTATGSDREPDDVANAIALLRKHADEIRHMEGRSRAEVGAAFIELGDELHRLGQRLATEDQQ